MGIFNNLFGDNISVKVTREEFEAYERERREILEKAKREVEQETNAALAARREEVAEKLKRSAIEAGPGKLRRLGWRISDAMALVRNRTLPLLSKTTKSLDEASIGLCKFIDKNGTSIAWLLSLASAAWFTFFCVQNSLGTNFVLIALPSIPFLITLTIVSDGAAGWGCMAIATLYSALIIGFTNFVVVSPSANYVAIRKVGAKTILENCGDMPFIVRWDPTTYKATTFFSRSGERNRITVSKIDVLHTKVDVTLNCLIKPDPTNFIDVYYGKIDSDKAKQITANVVSKLIDEALKEIEKRDDIILEAKNGFPRTSIEKCLINLLKARLYAATYDLYWRVDADSFGPQETNITPVIN